ncbi:MAG: relaxase/mobilization nuclease domain-containing protein, partial [Burkholderiaceae bacterium]|nr:relaxase/mobilization nuclease domain-containing protein [Burkholderiaceae bacterium]
MLLEPILGKSLLIRRKGNHTPNLLARIRRVSRGATEVMVKITGFGKGFTHIRSHMDYISRNGKNKLETETGETLQGQDSIHDYLDCWKRDITSSRAYRPSNRDTMHLVLSMPASVDSESVRKATREFAKETFNNHAYVFTLHTDAAHPHCHLSVRMEGFNGKRLNPKKADLQAWRDAFAEKMREQGIEAESTPRHIRGVTRKAEKSVIRNIEKQRVSKARARKVREAVNEMTGKAVPSQTICDIEAKAINRQRHIRRAWLNTAWQLEAENPSLAQEIHQMVRNMPVPETERQQLKRALRERFGRQQEQQPERQEASAG